MGVIKAVRVTECTCSVPNSREMQGSFKGSGLGEGSEGALKFRGQTLQRWYCRKGKQPTSLSVLNSWKTFTA